MGDSELEALGRPVSCPAGKPPGSCKGVTTPPGGRSRSPGARGPPSRHRGGGPQELGRPQAPSCSPARPRRMELRRVPTDLGGQAGPPAPQQPARAAAPPRPCQGHRPPPDLRAGRTCLSCFRTPWHRPGEERTCSARPAASGEVTQGWDTRGASSRPGEGSKAPEMTGARPDVLAETGSHRRRQRSRGTPGSLRSARAPASHGKPPGGRPRSPAQLGPRTSGS